jgi:hypothetical protein
LYAQDRASSPADFGKATPYAQGVVASGSEGWRVVDPASVPPMLPHSSAAPTVLQPSVVVSESASSSVPTPAGQTWPPTVFPPASAPVYAHPPQPVPPPVTAYRPLVPVAPPPAQYYLGRGLFGQPKLYVPEQPVRNFLRYLSF